MKVATQNEAGTVESLNGSTVGFPSASKSTKRTIGPTFAPTNFIEPEGKLSCPISGDDDKTGLFILGERPILEMDRDERLLDRLAFHSAHSLQDGT